jgi:hypothetical protein
MAERSIGMMDLALRRIDSNEKTPEGWREEAGRIIVDSMKKTPEAEGWQR